MGELSDRIADAIAELPEREKLVIALYYYENLTLREIGEVLGVTESRVSQMHTKAVLRLRSQHAGGVLRRLGRARRRDAPVRHRARRFGPRRLAPLRTRSCRASARHPRVGGSAALM